MGSPPGLWILSIHFLAPWGEEEEKDETSGPSLLVTHYNQLPKVLLCPQNPVGGSQASAEGFVAIHPWEPFGGCGKESRKRQGPCFAPAFLRALRHPMVWLVNHLLPFSLPSVFSLLPPLHFLPPLFLITVIDT